MSEENSQGVALTQRQLLLEVRTDVKMLDKKLDVNREDNYREFKRVDDLLGKRPTRAEVVSWFTLAGVLSGIVATLISAA